MIEISVKDNMDMLLGIESNTIDLIYCDILYGTGKKFKDYQDLQPIKEEVYGHYVPRLQQMYRVLKDSGTICLQMDIRIVHWIRCIMDDIFGYSNFRNQIVVKYNIGGYGKREFPKKHDLIVQYSKMDYFKFNDSKIRVPYKSVISKNQERPNITPEKLAIGTVPTNVWDDVPSGLRVKKHTNYSTEKHTKILERVINAFTDEGDLVADFYLGSGTTAYVYTLLNRNFIGCDINPYSIETTLNRLKL